MEYIEYIGPYIRYMREKQNIDVGDFCISCDITRVQLHNIEAGKCEAHPNTLKRLLDHLGICFVSLFRNQEEYKQLLDNMFQALMYDNIMEELQLMERIEQIDFEFSILFPEYLLIRLIYIERHDKDVEKLAILLSKLSLFMDVMLPKYQYFYYIFKSIYHKKRNELDIALKVLANAEDLPILEYRELLYLHYGKLYSILNKNLKALDYYGKASDLFSKKWNVNRMLYTKVFIGICYIHMRDYDMAENYLCDTMNLAKQYKNEYALEMGSEMLAMNCLLKREYKDCITYAKQGISLKGDCYILLFYVAYSYLKLGDIGSAALWAGKRDEFDQNTRIYRFLYYVKQLLDHNIPIIYLEEMFALEVHMQKDNLSYFILRELSEFYRSEQCFEEEANCLRLMLELDY